MSDIFYLRVRAMEESREVVGRQVVLCEPVTKAGKLIEDAWPFWIPIEWLVSLEDMKKAVRK